jgi:hypothetical protein
MPTAVRCKRSASELLLHRWVYLSRSLDSDSQLSDIERIIRRASSHGFNGVVFASSLDQCDLQPPEYLARLAKVKRICDSYRVEIIPSVCSAGYGDGTLAHNRNLAAALPVRSQLYIVSNGWGRFAADGETSIENGGFEIARGNKARGYSLQDRPGKVSFIDRDVRRSGEASLRFESFDKSISGNGRAMQIVSVKPFHCYRVSVSFRTRNLDPVGGVSIQVRALNRGLLMSMNPPLRPTEDWHDCSIAFNSLENTEVRVYAGEWSGKSGTLWIDGFAIEDVGPVNILRRPGTPVVVVDDATGETFEEGRDFRLVADSLLSFHADHQPPAVEIIPGGRIRDGQRLRLNAYQGLALDNEQVSVCMSEPEVYEHWRASLRVVQKYLSPMRYFLSMDEIREGGWCAACQGRGMSAAEILGDCITRQATMIREINPRADIFIWSDMLDPNHNAVPDYYLFKGSFVGSWEHVPPYLGIVCWYYDVRKASLRHFDGLGFRTLGAAYYDSPDLASVTGWIDALTETKGACGIMYTTWQNRYDLLEAFGDLVSRPPANR